MLHRGTVAVPEPPVQSKTLLSSESLFSSAQKTGTNKFANDRSLPAIKKSTSPPKGGPLITLAQSLAPDVQLHIDSLSAEHIQECGFKLHVLISHDTVVSLKGCLQQALAPRHEAANPKGEVDRANYVNATLCNLPPRSQSSIGEFFHQQLMNTLQVLIQYSEFEKAFGVVLHPNPYLNHASHASYTLHSGKWFFDDSHHQHVEPNFAGVEVRWEKARFLVLPRQSPINPLFEMLYVMDESSFWKPCFPMSHNDTHMKTIFGRNSVSSSSLNPEASRSFELNSASDSETSSELSSPTSPYGWSNIGDYEDDEQMMREIIRHMMVGIGSTSGDIRSHNHLPRPACWCFTQMKLINNAASTFRLTNRVNAGKR
jgi:hypothetical protein